MMRWLSAMAFGVAILACCVTPASAQRWRYPPGPPYRSCPDTLNLFDVQNPDTLVALCHPATLDTVYGVRGIITGFDARPSAYGFYIQSTFADGPHGWTGVDVFTGATNYNSAVPGTPTGGNLALGDSVVVYGTTQEFPATNGETEIEGPDAVQSTNDIIIRKINGGNALPPPKVGTTHDFNWVPGISAATSEPFEGCLVRINGPLKVGRVAGSGVAGNTFLIANPFLPSDSVLVDGFTLFLFGTPPLGTNIEFVQGILNQRNSTTGTGSVNSYRIQIRDVNDISLAAPPNLVEAYPLEDNLLRLIFDKNLDLASAQTLGNYSLGSGINGSTVDNAVLVGGAGTTVELTITSVLSPGDDETVTAQNIGTATCPTLCLSPSQTLEFAQGITPIYDESPTLAPLTVIRGIQAPDPAFLSPACDDRSRYAGPGTAFGRRVTIRGVGIQQYGSLHYLESEVGGRRKGVSVFGPSQPLSPGHKYRIACRVQEFGGETELVNTVDIKDEGVVAEPGAIVKSVAVLSDTTCDGTQTRDTGEDYEGVLVQVRKVEVAAFANPPRDPIAGGSFLVIYPPHVPGAPFEPPRDTILVSSLGGHYTFDADTGAVLNVTGVLHFDNNSFRILPRSNADIEPTDLTGVGGGSLALALRVQPNPGTSHKVSFALPRRDRVELGVYDLAGRRVVLIARGVMEAGTYSRRWDGRGSDGSRVGAGMYFYRLKVGSEVRTTRAVMLD